ncbi:MAG: TlpA family protein disulfide reductase [Planctomycetota bacterium]
MARRLALLLAAACCVGCPPAGRASPPAPARPSAPAATVAASPLADPSGPTAVASPAPGASPGPPGGADAPPVAEPKPRSGGSDLALLDEMGGVAVDEVDARVGKPTVKRKPAPRSATPAPRAPAPRAPAPRAPGARAPASPEPDPGPSPLPADGLSHHWPAVKGRAYPDLQLFDLEGNPFALSSLRGKVVLLEPVGLPCPACIAFSGGKAHGAFRGTKPQADLEDVWTYLERYGVRAGHPDLVVVQVVFYGTYSSAPKLADVRAWAEHFALERHPNTRVLWADARYTRPVTYQMIPGFQLIDRRFRLLLDSTGHRPQDDLGQLLVALRQQLR